MSFWWEVSGNSTSIVPGRKAYIHKGKTLCGKKTRPLELARLGFKSIPVISSSVILKKLLNFSKSQFPSLRIEMNIRKAMQVCKWSTPRPDKQTVFNKCF